MEIEEKLKRIKNSKGESLYSHLSSVIGKMMLDQCKTPYESFERYSEEIRACDNFEGFVDADLNLIREGGADLRPTIEGIRKLLRISAPSTDPEAPKEEEPAQIGEVPDLMHESCLAREVGIGIGEEDAYLLHNSLKKFCGEKNFTKVSFWGKILCRKRSYWITESHGDFTDESEDLKEAGEPRGKGVNSRNFWVTTDLISGGWSLLPLVSQRQIMQSRRIKYAFSGDLERKIVSSPPFDGQEKHFVDLPAKMSSREDLPQLQFDPKGSL